MYIRFFFSIFFNIKCQQNAHLNKTNVVFLSFFRLCLSICVVLLLLLAHVLPQLVLQFVVTHACKFFFRST